MPLTRTVVLAASAVFLACPPPDPGPQNECLNGKANCGVHAACTDTAGGFTCACANGYTGDGHTCLDVDECASNTDNCSPNASCTNTSGSFTCLCNSGYTGNGVTCADADECGTNTDNCSSNATCTNTVGSFTCACNAGYTGNGVTCTDIDECFLQAGNCGANAHCVNAPGTFSCACNTGYQGDGYTCSDVDECALNTDNCSAKATCANTIGTFNCECIPGYSGDGVSCTDIDECALNTDDCAPPPGGQCTNTAGSFTCSCHSGFTGNGFTCADIDECAGGTVPCGANAGCVNSPGSYDCTCNTGWAGDGYTCVLAPTLVPGLAVAWTDSRIGNAEIYARAWSGTAWVELGGSASGGGISATATASTEPAIALDASGNPVVAWLEDLATGTAVYLRRWNGSAWVELAGSASGYGLSNTAVGDAMRVDVAVDDAGRIYAVYEIDVGPAPGTLFSLYLKRWTGTAWETLPAGGGAFTYGARPSIAIDAYTRPVVAYILRLADVFVERWERNTWRDLFTDVQHGISGDTADWPPSISIGADSLPLVAWSHIGGGNLEFIRAKAYDGWDWLQVGPDISQYRPMGSFAVSAVVDSNLDKVVAWGDGALGGGVGPLWVRKWSGSAWNDVGSLTGVGGPSLAPLDGGKLVMTWSQPLPDQRWEIYVARWNGTAWDDYASSASGAGISNSPGPSQSLQPRVAARP